MGKTRQPWRPIYREALPVMLGRLFEELEVSLSDVVERSNRGWSDWSRYVNGKHVPRRMSPLARGLGVSALDLERAWVVTCAELLDLTYVDVGGDVRSPADVEKRFAYWRVFQGLLGELQELYRFNQTECARRAGLSASSWNDYVHGRIAPERNLPKIARGLDLDVGELERRIVLRCLEETGLAPGVRVLEPGPRWAFYGVLTDDGRLVVVDTLKARLQEYDLRGEGRSIELPRSVGGLKRVARSPEGALWVYGQGQLVELSKDLHVLRSYGVWGRRSVEGQLLESICQWTLLDDQTLVAVSDGRRQAFLIRMVLTSSEAGRFEVLRRFERWTPAERRYFAEGSPKIATADGRVYVLRLAQEATEVWAPDGDQVMARYPGGLRAMKAARQDVGDGFGGVSALGLVAVDDEVLVWRRHDREYWLEDLGGRVRCGPRKSNATRVVPVVGRRVVGLLKTIGPSEAAEHAAGLLWLETWQEGGTGASS